MDKVKHQVAMAKTVATGFLSLMLGRKAKVVWGSNAMIDRDGVIYLPNPKVGSPSELARLTRQAMHEAGHADHTDWSQVPPDIDGNVRAFFNALEDARMEGQQMQVYKGAHIILNRELDADLGFILEHAQQDDSPQGLARLAQVTALVRTGQRISPKEALFTTGQELLAVADRKLPAEVKAAISKAADAMVHAKCTGDALNIAQQLWMEIQPPPPPPPEQASQPQQGGDGAGDASEAQSGSADTGDEESGPQAGAEQAAQAGDDSSADGKQAEASSEDAPSQGAAEDAPKQDGKPQGNAEPDMEPVGSGSEGSGGSEGSASASGASQGGADQPEEPGAGAGGSDNGGEGNGESAPATQARAGDNADIEGEAGQPVPDMAAVAGEDMGTWMQEAYEAEFGAADIDPQGAQSAPQECPAHMELVIAQAMDAALAEGDELDKVLALALAAVQAAEEEQSEPAAVPAAGSGLSGPVVVGFSQEYRLQGVVSHLTRVFQREMQERRRRNVHLADSGRVVASERAWRLKRLGDTRIFRAAQQVAGIEAAVEILLDRSRSMDESIEAAANCALACSQALERISRVTTGIHLFPGEHAFAVPFKPFGVSTRGWAKKGDSVNAGGGTPLAEALAVVVPQLLQQRMSKHVLILISDGEPDNLHSALAQIESARKLGVDIVGIGMGPRRKFIEALLPRDSVQIASVAELPAALEKLFRERVSVRLAA